jgi:hypothetical protein
LQNLKNEIKLENCETHDLSSEACALENFEKVTKFVFGSIHEINSTEISFDPYFIEQLQIFGSEVEVFDISIGGLSNQKINGVYKSKNEYEDSFLIAANFLMPRLNGSGDYKLDWKLGVFYFNAKGEFNCETCKFIFR